MLYLYILDPPHIDEGSFVPRPSSITRENKRVKIGTPVYVHSGFDVIIDCNIVIGTPPITIEWFRNGSPDPTRGNVSNIIITDACDNEVFKCRADNHIGFDIENTTIYVEYGKYIYISQYMHIYYLFIIYAMAIRCRKQIELVTQGQKKFAIDIPKPKG